MYFNLQLICVQSLHKYIYFYFFANDLLITYFKSMLHIIEVTQNYICNIEEKMIFLQLQVISLKWHMYLAFTNKKS